MIEQYGCECRDLYSGVASFEVVGRISLGDSEFLSFLDGGVERKPLLDLFEHYIRSGIQNPMERVYLGRGHGIPEQRKHRHSIHHCRLEQEL
jgi:hypothetical protein